MTASDGSAQSAEREMSFRRVLVKISGEALMGPQSSGVHGATLDRIADDLKRLAAHRIEIAIVVGGGNIFRGLAGAAGGMERSSADYMGMLATVMNALALQSALERQGVEARVQSAIPMPTMCESYARREAVGHLEAGRIVIFGAGTGNPFFTTDTAAVLRAIETGCDAMWKGTQVDGVYSGDPKTDPEAERYDAISYTDVLVKDLRVMDATAIALARENKLPVIVFNLLSEGGFEGVRSGAGAFTLVHDA